jgi:hypothetical protein
VCQELARARSPPAVLSRAASDSHADNHRNGRRSGASKMGVTIKGVRHSPRNGVLQPGQKSPNWTGHFPVVMMAVATDDMFSSMIQTR